jgi:hypothetical protein
MQPTLHALSTLMPESLKLEWRGAEKAGSSPDVQDEADLLLRVGLCGDNEQAVQQVNGNSVWTAGRCYTGRRQAQLFNSVLPVKISSSPDCRLQLNCFKPESIAMASQLRSGETVRGLCAKG